MNPFQVVMTGATSPVESVTNPVEPPVGMASPLFPALAEDIVAIPRVYTHRAVMGPSAPWGMKSVEFVPADYDAAIAALYTAAAAGQGVKLQGKYLLALILGRAQLVAALAHGGRLPCVAPRPSRLDEARKKVPGALLSADDTMVIVNPFGAVYEGAPPALASLRASLEPLTKAATSAKAGDLYVTAVPLPGAGTGPNSYGIGPVAAALLNPYVICVVSALVIAGLDAAYFIHADQAKVQYLADVGANQEMLHREAEIKVGHPLTRPGYLDPLMKGVGDSFGSKVTTDLAVGLGAIGIGVGLGILVAYFAKKAS